MDYLFLSNTSLFCGTSADEVKAMLQCLGAHTKNYAKGEVIYHAGQVVESMGMVLSGSTHIEYDDVWGNRSLINHVEAGQIFAETYACIPGEPLSINVTAVEYTEVLFLNTTRLLQTCSDTCAHHSRLIKNLLQILAQRNLNLSKRILHTSSKSIRGRLLSYFSEQTLHSGSYHFTIPFNRQQLADYLGVDRSALSNELSKMQRDGIITYEKNTFCLNQLP